MESYKKKILIFLAAIALCFGVKLVSSAANGAPENTKVLFNKSAAIDDQPNLAVGSNNNNIGVSGLFYKMIFMVLLVVFLGIAVIYVSKKLLPKLNLPGKRIQVTETVHIGPRKSIHLIKIGKKTLLIGSTNENICSLADVTDQITEMDLSANQMDDN